MNADPLVNYPPMMLPGEVAEVLRTTEAALAQWRHDKAGPPYVKMTARRNGRVLYPRERLRAYLAERTMTRTAAEPAS